jgi:hypothetical protein
MPVIVLLPILVVAVWLAVATFVVAVCRAASYGDRSAGDWASQTAGGGRESAVVTRRPCRPLAAVERPVAPAGPRV